MTALVQVIFAVLVAPLLLLAYSIAVLVRWLTGRLP